MSCILRVTSGDNDLTPFITKSGLPIYQSHRRGDVPKIGRRKSAYENSGFSCEVSECKFSDLPGQIADALFFLRQHEAELRALRADPKIDDLRLDFPYWLRIGEAAITQCDYLPPSLVKLCGDLGVGIELSLCPKSQEEESTRPSTPLTPPPAAT